MNLPRRRFLLLALAAASPRPLAQPVVNPLTAPLEDLETPAVDEETAQLIAGAMRYLAAKQMPTGAWGLSDFERRHPVAMTAYTLLSFLAAGHLPGEGEHGRVVQKGLDYLLEKVRPDGTIGDNTLGQYMYNHGVAAIALAELYGQTRHPDIRPKLERMIRLIIASQNAEGGWRYRPVPRDADISVTVLQVVALRAAKNSGLEVPQTTIDNAIRYVRNCFDPGSGGFTYQPGNRAPGFARTAAAIYSLQVCGVYDDPLVQRGSEYLVKNFGQPEWFTYGNFYAAPAQYLLGGEVWKRWYPRVRHWLVRRVKREGDHAFWDGSLDAGSGGLGPIYSTAVYAGILAMPLNYVPIYQR